MLRWISDVPSQIRSTRTSRKKRSATFSRMYPRPAEDLDRPVGHAARHLAGVELRHRALRVLDLHVDARVDVLGQPVRHEARRPELGERVGEHVRDRLVLHDGAAELDSRPCANAARLVDRAVRRRRSSARRSSSRSYRNHSYVNDIPSPSAPIRFSTGTCTSSNATTRGCRVRVHVARARATSRTPGVSLSTKNIACAPWFEPPAIFAWTQAVAGHVERGDVHLLAAHDVVVAVAHEPSPRSRPRPSRRPPP